MERPLPYTRAISLAISFLCDKKYFGNMFFLAKLPILEHFFLSKNDVKVMFWTTKNSWHLKVILCWFKIDLDNYRWQVDFEKLLFTTKIYSGYLNKNKISSAKMVFCYQNCSALLWEKIVLVIEIFFWNLRLKAKNLQTFTFWDHKNNLSNSERSEQFLVTECFRNLFLKVSHL